MVKVNAWLVVGIFAIAGIIVAVIASNDDDDNVSRVPAIEIFGSEILSLCESPEDSTIDGTVPIEDNYPRKLAILTGGDFSTYQAALPEDWRANDLAELDVVLCAESERIDVQICEYKIQGTGDEQAFVYRTKGIATMYAFTPDGRLFDIITIEGLEPDRCPNSLVLKDDQREVYQNGPLIFAVIEQGLTTLATGRHPQQPPYPFDIGEGPIDDK